MALNDSPNYFAPQAELTRLFTVKNLDTMAECFSKLKLPRICAPQFAEKQFIDSHTLRDIGLNSHQVSYRMMKRGLVD